MRYFYDRINCYQAFEYLHEKYRNQVFDELEVKDKPQDYFYDKKVFEWVQSVMDNTPGEIVFKAARVYGDGTTTTSALRFIFPYEKIPAGSRVALVGAGIMGRHYYSQTMLNSYCDIVCWVENNNAGELSYISDYSMLEKCDYDYVLIAYLNPQLVQDVLSYLKSINCSCEKIIIGME
jgi:hypothetical protein